MEIIDIIPVRADGKGSLNGCSLANTPLPFGKKRDVAKMLNISVRTVDNFISDGCPVVKMSPRCCRFDLLEVKEWAKTRYGQQSRKNLY